MPRTAPTTCQSAGVLPLMATPTISNVQICHVLIDGGAGLNVMSLHAFEALQIPMSKLKPLRHSVVGATILCGRMVTSLSLSHTLLGQWNITAPRWLCSM
jgi:hypothetical protein